MPASTNASYVGRFAPPGYPNTTSTPSAFRHSMTASTARIISAPSFPGTRGKPAGCGPAASLTAQCVRFGLDRDLGEVEIGPAAVADRVVKLEDLAAGGALAPQLVAVVAIEQRRQQPGDRDERRDQEPEHERGALDLADDPPGQAEEEAEDQVGHGLGMGSAVRRA